MTNTTKSLGLRGSALFNVLTVGLLLAFLFFVFFIILFFSLQTHVPVSQTGTLSIRIVHVTTGESLAARVKIQDQSQILFQKNVSASELAVFERVPLNQPFTLVIESPGFETSSASLQLTRNFETRSFLLVPQNAVLVPCTNECSVNGEINGCSTATAQNQCGQFDADECLEYGALVCPSGQTCMNGTCSTPIACQTNLECDDNNPATLDACNVTANQCENSPQTCSEISGTVCPVGTSCSSSLVSTTDSVACCVGNCTASATTNECTNCTLQLVGTIEQPHGWGAQFAKVGNTLFTTRRETHLKLGVVDVSNPSAMTYKREVEMPKEASSHIALLNSNTLLVDTYTWIEAVDVTNPQNPTLLSNLQWKPDNQNNSSQPPGVNSYVFEVNNNKLYLANGQAIDRLFRVYDTSTYPPSAPLATVDLTSQIAGLDDPIETTVNDLLDYLYPVSQIVFSSDNTQAFVAYGPFIARYNISDPANPQLTYWWVPCANEGGIGVCDWIESIALSADNASLWVATSDRGHFKADGNRDWIPSASPKGIVTLDVSNTGDLGTYVSRPATGYPGLEIPQQLLVNGTALFAVGWRATTPEDRKIDGIDIPNGLYQTYYQKRTLIKRFDVTNPSNLSQTHEFVFPLQSRIEGYQHTYWASKKLLVDNGTLFVDQEDFGIWALNPDSLSVIGRRTTVSNESNGILVEDNGSRAIMQTGARILFANLQTHQLFQNQSDLAQIPVVLSPISFVVPSGQRYYYSTGRGTVQAVILDLADFSNPKLAGFVPLNGQAYNAMYANGYFFALTGSTKKFDLQIFEPINGGAGLQQKTLLQVFDFGNEKGVQSFGGYTLFDITPDNKAVIVLWNRDDKTAVITVDLSNISNPVVLGSKLFSTPELVPGLWNSTSVYKDGFVYIVGGGWKEIEEYPPRLQVVDVHNPSNFTVVTSVALEDPQAISDEVHQWNPIWNPPFVYAGATVLRPEPYLVIHSYHHGLRLVNIQNPTNPVLTWKEPYPRPPLTLTGPLTRGWSSGVYMDTNPNDIANGDLFVPRLYHVDHYRLVPQ